MNNRCNTLKPTRRGQPVSAQQLTAYADGAIQRLSVSGATVNRYGGQIMVAVDEKRSLGRSDSLFAVTVEQTGGSAGTQTAYCTFSYTVKGSSGNTLATGLQPENSRARIFKIQCTAGSKGTAYYDAGGTLHLWDCDETAAQTNCT